MSDPAHLEPLVTEAHAQYAACRVRLEKAERLARSYPSMQPLPEDVSQRLEKARVDAEYHRALWLRLKSKLDAGSVTTVETL